MHYLHIWKEKENHFSQYTILNTVWVGMGEWGGGGVKGMGAIWEGSGRIQILLQMKGWILLSTYLLVVSPSDENTSRAVTQTQAVHLHNRHGSGSCHTLPIIIN